MTQDTPAAQKAPVRRRKAAAAASKSSAAAAPVVAEDKVGKVVAMMPASLPPAADAVVELKKPELIDKVIARAGLKKREAKPAVEALLEILGEALAEGRDLNLNPLGKVKTVRTKELANGAALTLRMRRVIPKKKVAETQAETADGADKEPLAKPAKEG